MGRIPDRWEEYGTVGERVAGTRFISFKVPLKEILCRQMPSHLWFTPQMLLNEVRNLGVVIDLTNTSRYYHNRILDAGVEYVKIFTEGHIVPSADVQKRFFEAVDKFLIDNAHNERLIGVHCTHGLNRTGYLVCRYMIDRMQFKPQDAIDTFNAARGHCIERERYLADLLGSEEKPADTAQCPRLHGHTAADHPTSRSSSHRPRGNYAGRRNTATPVRTYPPSRDFHPQRDFRSAASGWRPPNAGHRSAVDQRVVNGWNQSSVDWWRYSEPSCQFPSSGVPLSHSTSSQTHRVGQLDGWTNGQLYSGGQQWDQEWTQPVSRRQHRYRGSAYHPSRSVYTRSTRRSAHGNHNC